MDFKIDKSVPIPEKTVRRAKYPFKNMEEGDSFFVPLPDGKSPSGVYASISTAKNRLKINLTTAREDGGIRVWRIPQESST
jgi:hypothetical protein